MTHQDAIENHRKLWNWIAERNRQIAENGTGQEPVTNEKYFDEHGIPENKRPELNCYLCEHIIQKTWELETTDVCDYCPLDWTDNGKVESEICTNRNKTGLHDLFSKAVLDKDASECARLAKRIADLPDRYEKIGRLMSVVLRHRPETIGIALDEHGWAKVPELIDGIKKQYPFNIWMLEEIVRTDSKQRYSFNKDKTLIRANQGHSIQVDVELETAEPPKYLYHGTAEKSKDKIDREGIKPMKRLYVHLSKDIETAVEVGRRHGKPIVYVVDTGRMHADGHVFYKSVNGVWLTKYVPVEYLSRMEEQDTTHTTDDGREHGNCD